MSGKFVLCATLLAAAVAGAIKSSAGISIGFQAAPGPVPVPAWEVQKSGTDAGLRGVSAPDENTAWASGAAGTILRTVDGGRTWRSVSVPGMSRTDFRDVEGFDAATAVVMGIGRPAEIFRTADGGERWTEVYNNDAPGVFLDAIAFADSKNGWAVGDPMDGRIFLLTTADGGRSWAEIPPARRPAAAEGEGLFAASGTCLEAGGETEVRFCTGGPLSRVFHTADGGRTWAVAPSPLLSGRPSYGAFSIAVRGDGPGILVGGDYRAEGAAEKNAAFSVDGGKTWTLVEERRPGGFRECAAFVSGTSPLLAVAVGPSGSDLSADGGRTWTPLSGPAGLHAITFAGNGKCGWAVGRGGLIAKIQIGR